MIFRKAFDYMDFYMSESESDPAPTSSFVILAIIFTVCAVLFHACCSRCKISSHVIISVSMFEVTDFCETKTKTEIKILRANKSSENRMSKSYLDLWKRLPP